MPSVNISKAQTPSKKIVAPVSTEYPLVLVGNLGEYGGYDILTCRVIEELVKFGVPLRVKMLNKYTPSAWLLPLCRWNVVHGWEMYIGPPDKLQYNSSTSNIVFTMWEAGRLSLPWVRDLSLNSRLVMLPCEWNMITFDASGIQSELKLVPLGCDLSTYNKKSQCPQQIVFGTAASLTTGGKRKNINQTIECFQRAFPDQENVKLKIKLTPYCEFTNPIDSRITVTRHNVNTSEMSQWYDSITAFVSTSHAEGFGLHLLEAMACGRPVIAPKFSGSTEYMTNDNSYPVKYTLVPASCDHKLYKGLWSQTDSDSLVEAMRRVYNNPDECEEKGTLAAEDAKRFSWEATGRRIYSSLMQCGAVVDSKKIRSTEVLAVKVKIVILTWNAFLSTKKYIESFIDYPLPSNADWQFIDNASTDQTIPLLCAWNMPLIRNDANLGFTKAANQGITSCHEDIVLMNNDTIVLHNEWLFQLQKTAYSSDDIGVVGCVIVDQEKNITHCGGELTSTGQGRNIVCKAEECVGIIDREYVTFACVYIKRSTIEKIGLLDESYFAYYEDVDYCFRAKEAGLRVVVDSSVIVLHNENSSSQANKTDLKSLIDQSHKTFESKWTPNCQMLSNHKR